MKWNNFYDRQMTKIDQNDKVDCVYNLYFWLLMEKKGTRTKMKRLRLLSNINLEND